MKQAFCFFPLFFFWPVFVFAVSVKMCVRVWYTIWGGVLGCGIAQRAARLQKAKRCAISFSDVSVQNYFSMAKFGRTPSAVVRPLEERDADPRALSVRLVRARKHVAQEFLRRGERRRRFAKRTGRL